MSYPRLGLLWIVTVVLYGVLSIEPASARQPASGDIQNGVLAQSILDRVPIQRGLCAVINGGEVVGIELAKRSDWLIHVREPDEAKIVKIRQAALAHGLSIRDLVVQQASPNRMTFGDNVVDVVIGVNASPDLLDTLPAEEVIRSLRPHGLALIGVEKRAGQSDARMRERLQEWAADAPAVDVKLTSDESGVWIEFSKSEPEGIDEWTHWEKSPDNNPVSTDRIIQAPYMTQFLAKPLYIGMPSVTTAAGGRTFLAIGHIAHHPREWNMLNKLIARNGYNGIVLWERDLPEGYLVHRSAFIATSDTFYMIDGRRALMLDPATGQQQGTIEVDGLNDFWQWMAIEGNTLYVMTGKRESRVKTTRGDRTFGGWSWADLSEGYYGETGNYNSEDIPWGFGDTIAAYDLEQQKTLWIHKEEAPIDSRSLSMTGERLFFLCPEVHLRGLNSQTGELIWTNQEKEVVDLIRQPGRGLTSTPGFKTQCITVATPDALVIQGQTRGNVVAVSTADGYHLWTKKKITNNPNAIFIDGNIILGVGEGGNHVAIDPVSGAEQADLGFRKAACTRLTACVDSIFCRGEGTLRFDRESNRVMIDGAQRPACNDGAMPAHGLLYLGPWQCDCNLSLIGLVAKCSAGDFVFNQAATVDERRTLSADHTRESDFEVTKLDWPTYRANHSRSSSSQVKLQSGRRQLNWAADLSPSFVPSAPVAAGGLIYVAGDGGIVRAFDAESGDVKWEFPTGAPVLYPPTISDGNAYFGSGDGYAYCVSADTGDMLWKFRAAPEERTILVYDYLQSTWPVHSGVLVKDGVAYFAAGIIDHDGTHIYALDAKTGDILWQNNHSGHLNPELKKGVSVQGNLTISDTHLLLAGGNQFSPARFDLETGECLETPRETGRPQANNGNFVGNYLDDSVIVGGRILHAAPENVSTKGSFQLYTTKGAFNMNQGGIPPVWNERSTVMVNFKNGKLTCCDSEKVAERLGKGYQQNRPSNPVEMRWYNLAVLLERDAAIRWHTDMNQPNKFEAISLAVCPNAVVGVVKYQDRIRAQPSWYLIGCHIEDGRIMFRQELRGEPLPGGILVDREGQIVVTMIDGRLLCFRGA